MSAYLTGTDNKSKKAVDISQNRTTKFIAFDGINRFPALEYERLDMVYDFNSTPIILALRPPIMVKKGMLLLKKMNVEVLTQPDVVRPKPTVNQVNQQY